MDALGKLVTRALDRTSGALRGVRSTPWVPIARVEDGAMSHPEETRLTATVLAQVARNLNPSQYTPAVVVGASPGQSSIGPTHAIGEWLDPVGHVSAMEFDGLTLWAKLTDIVERNGKGRIEDAISRGRSQRSVAIWMQAPADGNAGSTGGGAMLRHLALLGGEPPGQFGLPPLTRYIESALGPEVAQRSATWPVITRSYEDDAPSTTEPADPGEENSMTPEELQAAMAAVLKDALAPLDAKVTALETASAERARKTEEDLTATRTLVTTLQAETAASSITARLDALVSAGKLPPADKDFELAALRAVPAEVRDSRLAALEARRSVIAPTRKSFIPTPETAATPIPQHVSMAAVQAGRVSARSMEAWPTAQKLLGDKPEPARVSEVANVAHLGMPDWLTGGAN